MKQKGFSLLLVLCMVVSLLPATVFAAGAALVTVGGVELDGSGGTVYATTDSLGNVAADGATESNYNIKLENGILTLKDATITGAANGRDNYGVYTGSGALTISLEGKNTVTAGDAAEDSSNYWGDSKAIYVDGASLKISGDGSLTISSGEGASSYGIYASGVTIQSSAVVEATAATATADADGAVFYSCGIYSAGDGSFVAVSDSAKVTAVGAAVNATAKSAGIRGMNITIGGKTTVTAMGNTQAVISSNLKAADSAITAATDTAGKDTETYAAENLANYKYIKFALKTDHVMEVDFDGDGGDAPVSYDNFTDGWKAAMDTNTTGTTVKLLKDWTADENGYLGPTDADGAGFNQGSGTADTYTGSIRVPIGKTITLDLNGHTIDRNLKSSKANGYIVVVNGTLTLKDTKGGGTLTGGNDSEAGGVSVYGGTFTMESGSISGNKGAGVYILRSGSSFTMKGGSIENNNGYGVYYSNTSVGMTLSGAPVIKDNTVNGSDGNLYLATGKTITIGSGGLKPDASIGVSLSSSSWPAENESKRIATGSNQTDFLYFYSDKAGYETFQNADENTVCLRIEKAVHTHSYNSNGFCDCGAYQPADLNGDVYEISNAGQLFWFAGQVNGGDNTINGLLMNNIDLSVSQTIPWIPIGQNNVYFKGSFNGDGYTISNLYIDSTSHAQGLFGKCNGSISNVIVDGTINSSENTWTGGICGNLGLSGSISSCVNAVKIVSTGNNVGGIVGYNYGKISNCCNLAEIQGNLYVGGICGMNQISYDKTDWGLIENCYNAGVVSSSYDTYYASGICGISIPEKGTALFNNYCMEGTEYGCWWNSSNTIGFLDGAVEIRSAGQFSSGEVAWLLNGGKTDGTQAWFQTVETDDFPGISGDTVFQVNKYDCPDDTTAETVYRNSNAEIRGSEHVLGPWQTDQDSHWKVCEHCNSQFEKAVHTGGQATYLEPAICELCGAKYGNRRKDETAPTGRIQVKEKNWNSFDSTETFDIFCKDKYDVTIIAEDGETGVASIRYYLSETVISKDEIANASGWTNYEEAFSLEDEGKYIIYAQITDNSGNVTYIRSGGMAIDKTAPSVRGMENNRIYCSAVEAAVSDDYLNGVTVNGKVIEPVNGKFTVSPAQGTQEIVVTDRAGNETVFTITVNDGHRYVHHAPVLATHKADGTAEHYTCEICGLLFDKNENEVTAEALVTTKLSHSFGEEWRFDENQHWHECSCGEKSFVDGHAFLWVMDKEATGSAAGSKHEECRVCGYQKAAVEIPALLVPEYPPVIIKTKGGTVVIDNQKPHAGDPVTITPKPEDGKQIDQIIVTDKNGKRSSVKENGDGTYTFIQPNNGEVTIQVLFENKSGASSPQTGDSANMWLWVTLMFASCGGVTAIYSKKKKTNR